MSHTFKPGETIARFLTQGGAHVDLTADRFHTRLLRGNETVSPDVGSRECDGFQWECRGCRITSATRWGRATSFSARNTGRYLDGEYGYARQDANQHSTECRAVPLDTP